MKTRHVIALILLPVLVFTWGRWRQRSQLGPILVQSEWRGPNLTREPEQAQAAADGRLEARPAKPKHRGAGGPKATHRPDQPKSGQAVEVTVEFGRQGAPAGGVALEYQVVEPGKYIALRDAAFSKQWTTIPMTARGPSVEQAEGIFAAEIPASVQKHRCLVRYRFRSLSGNNLIAPQEDDPQPNFAYFVYDGVPAWKGAINPRSGDSRLREVVTYSSEALQRVPVYHLIASRGAVEKATWSHTDGYGDGARNSYRYTGTMVYDGVVYDHIGFRARGGAWRHAMGKNMWKFNFLPGHRFEARDDYEIPYKAKWDKLNLGACIQQGDYGMRGEQGMFEAVGFKLFNLAGIEAPLTHWVHFRIVDQAEESPADQYEGDFWGLYLAVENVDEHFLKEHQLPAGNVYKMESGAKTAFNGNPKIADQSDVHEFSRGLMRRQAGDGWWIQNLDLSRYYNYRSILECIHHYDIDGGKNYFYYLNPDSGKWAVIPWDIDLTWSERMYGGGHEPFYRSGLLQRAPFKGQYQVRLAEIRDLLFNPEQTGKLIDEHAALIWNGSGKPSLADADRAKWDYHPVMASRYSMTGKAGQGQFYFRNPKNTFRDMVKYMKSYTSQRAAWIDSRLLGDYRPPEPLKIAADGRLDFSASALRFEVDGRAADWSKKCRWRLAEVTDPKGPGFDPTQPWKYEINALWEQETSSLKSPEIPTNLLLPGHTFRVRVRGQDESGAWSRWSAPAQFTAPGR